MSSGLRSWQKEPLAEEILEVKMVEESNQADIHVLVGEFFMSSVIFQNIVRL